MDSSSISGRSGVPSFDPFEAAPLFKFAATWRSHLLLLLLPCLLILAIVITTTEGTLGSWVDFQIWADTRRTLGANDVPPANPQFPFLRDYPSWFLVVVIVMTCALVHRQWQTMALCLPGLRRNEVLIPRDQPVYGRIHRTLRLPSVMQDVDGGDHLAALTEKIRTRVIQPIGRLNVLVAFSAVLLTALLVLGQNRTGIFEVIAPKGQSRVERADWLELTYQSWWAGTSHLGGVLLYSAIATLGIYVILLQNIVGLVAVYIIMSIPALEETDVDWTNFDGRHGWTPLAEAYQTVVRSVVLHGLALSLLLVVLGIDNFRWVLVLWGLWALILPLYIVVPHLVFRTVARQAKERRYRLIEETRESGRRAKTVARRLVIDAQCSAFRAQVDDAVIRPLRLRRRDVARLLIGIVFPLALAVGQLLFSVQFGSDG